MARILIIDDDEDIVTSMTLTLQSRGYQVEVASNGADGLKSIRKFKPDAIVLDVMMPPPDGFELARIVKKDPEIKHIPILMLTAISDRLGFSFENDAGDPDWLPVEEYCAKPLDYETLIAKLEKLLKTK